MNKNEKRPRTQEEEIMERVQVLSPSAYRLILELKDPAILKSDFVTRIDQYNAPYDKVLPVPLSGGRSQYEFHLKGSRILKVSIFENGRVFLGWSDFS